MSICDSQLIELVIRPVLQELGMYSVAAEKLVAGTIAQESDFGKYLHQISGPALGICQIEPFTHDDIYKNYLFYRSDIKEILFEVSGISTRTNYAIPPSSLMIYNLRYAVGMCRIHYYRVKEGLPDDSDIEGLAAYWKKYYNTVSGKGSESEFIKNWDTYVKDYYKKCERIDVSGEHDYY